ncbi:MAG: cytochrome C biogenesis protein [Leifsonia xyli]|nr:MAG: cytochrome C biogenesis protein [Leifsonia xyli]
MNGIVANGELWLAMPIALLAGLVSFASPCVLPLVPGYLGYVSGASTTRSRWRPLIGAGLFTLGFSLVFIAYGVAFGAVGGWLIRWQDILIRILGAVVLIMGLVFIGLLRVFQRTAKPAIKPPTGLVGAPLLGIAFGLGWTPCLGPTLAAISALSISTASAARGALLAVIYCIGLGLPFLAVAVGLGWATTATKFLRRHIRAINITGGAVMILTGILMMSGLWTLLIYSLQSLIGGTLLPV